MGESIPVHVAGTATGMPGTDGSITADPGTGCRSVRQTEGGRTDATVRGDRRLDAVRVTEVQRRPTQPDRVDGLVPDLLHLLVHRLALVWIRLADRVVVQAVVVLVAPVHPVPPIELVTDEPVS